MCSLGSSNILLTQFNRQRFSWFGISKCEIWKITGIDWQYVPHLGAHDWPLLSWLFNANAEEPSPHLNRATIFFNTISQHSNSRPKIAKSEYFQKNRFFSQLRKKAGIRISTQKRIVYSNHIGNFQRVRGRSSPNCFDKLFPRIGSRSPEKSILFSVGIRALVLESSRNPEK